MNVYCVYDGWMGNGPIHCIVVAPDEDRAKELARVQYEAENPGHTKSCKLEVELICSAESEFSSTPRDL